jgi:hypothetical protein
VPENTVSMATSTVSRLAPVTARDGVDTRKQENWGMTEVVNRETICQVDMITGLGLPTVNSGNTSIEQTANAEGQFEYYECDQCDCCGVGADLYNARCARCSDLGEEVDDDFRPYGQDVESEPDDDFYNQYLDIDDEFDF